MKTSTLSALGILSLAGLAHGETSKTLTPVKIDPLVIGTEPYRFNGAVLGDEVRGSGFVAWNQRAFFTAAHVVSTVGETSLTWDPPPVWCPTANGETEDLDEETMVLSRGYYRFKSYQSLTETQGSQTNGAFSRDAVLAFAFEDLIPGTPAVLNTNGYRDIRNNVTTMITGYPGENAYTEEDIEGFYMYQTGPGITPYQPFFGKAFRASLISTGPGNSGGPLWVQKGSSWVASGILVGGRPSESIVYAFSPDVNALTRSVAPIVKTTPAAPVSVAGVAATSYFFPMTKPKKLPDGVQRYTDFRFNVSRFEEGTKVSKVHLSLDITTDHQGDLFIILQGPGGSGVIVHNEEGGGIHNLVLDDKDFSEAFKDVYPNGPWMVRVQDRLKGDISTVNKIVLEIGAGKAETTTGGGTGGTGL
ncbi:proprotein convertase P-domain-containing protein [Luteolibacter ambystomatis]|uniref:Proprotein convertase P-domain-containing protein n=1 Tax=Luteolibacter ambystomatis TaxID=2824561 RepID=A0A975G6G7_9BACT|nr:proprotein convertase P-domain-containing protein [Luteolibacter ambystomatis]QUE49673.1 proprotein convertase P-domain-containing protein [Luteolibacter ambystomatis]